MKAQCNAFLFFSVFVSQSAFSKQKQEKERTDLRKNGLFLSFPYVCPEPVLSNDRFYIKLAQKDRFYSPVDHQSPPIQLL
eukprot:COSAG06_NODE_5001_length_3796_cov_29.826393_5_plen_80_part_00